MPELVIRRGLEEPDTSGAFTPHKPERPEKSMGGKRFELVSDYQPAGDQPTAIRELVDAAQEGEKTQVLLGVTGSGLTASRARSATSSVLIVSPLLGSSSPLEQAASARERVIAAIVG